MKQAGNSGEFKIENAFNDSSQNAVGPGAEVHMGADTAPRATPNNPAPAGSFVITGSFNNAHNNAVGPGARVSDSTQGWPAGYAATPERTGCTDSPASTWTRAASTPGGAPVVLLFSQQDRAWLERLRAHLSLLERQQLLSLWDTQQIATGADKREAMVQALTQARFAICLISASFLASARFAFHEWPLLRQRLTEGQLRLVPILLAPCLYERSQFARFQPLNPDRPLAQLSFAEQEELLAEAGRTLLHMLA